MFDIFIEKLKRLFSSRLMPISFIFVLLFGVLITRIFTLQIVESETYQEEVTLKNIKTREIKSTRGNFYDRNGVLLAYNELIYSVVLEDSTELTSNEDKNKMLHNLILILEKHGNTIENEFGLSINEEGELIFNVEGTAELRFKKNLYGKRSVDELKPEERNATAKEVFDYLRYGSSRYSTMFNISDEYTLEEALKIMTLRYALYTNYPKYNQIIIASDVSEETVAAVLENASILPGVEISKQTSRVYNESVYTAHMLGYTGLISDLELENLKVEDENTKYNSSDVIGKTGLEKVYESYLSGTKGLESITVNNSGKYLETISRTEPVAGNDVYLTIDIELQKSIYHIIERNLAGILLSKIVNSTDAGTRGESAKDIKIPIYDVYFALINNNIINLNELEAEDASDIEKQVFNKFKTKQKEVFEELDVLLSINNTKVNSSLSKAMSEYLTYIYGVLRDNKVLLTSMIDTDDENYVAYHNDKLSLSKFLQYAIANNWIDLTKLNIGDEYFSTDELYEKLKEYIKVILIDDSTFHKKIYSDLVYSYKLTGSEICLLLFDQGVLKYNEEDISKLKNGVISAYSFITEKIRDLSITPAQLALDPHSASVVVTDVNTGDVIAMVTYPSYDNNMLANRIDSAYWNKLNRDLTTPMIHRATKQKTAPGSTFKMVSAIAGLEEGVIGTTETILDQYQFTKINPSPKCWSTHSHGHVDVTGALEVSCNFFFYEVGWRLGNLSSNLNRDENGLNLLAKYAAMLGLDSKSGVEVEEAEPSISTRDSVRSTIGQGNAVYTPVQLARYVTTLANRGTLYNLTLIDKVVDKDGSIVLDNSATFSKLTDIKESSWDLVQRGMYLVGHGSESSSSDTLSDFPYEIAGKTGTAQESLSRGNHALFVSYAPFDNPEIAVTTVIPNGYASSYAVDLTKDVYSYYYNTEDRDNLVYGDAATTDSNAAAFSD